MMNIIYLSVKYYKDTQQYLKLAYFSMIGSEFSLPFDQRKYNI